MRMERGELSCREASSYVLFTAFPVSVCTVCEEAKGGGDCLYDVCLSFSALHNSTIRSVQFLPPTFNRWTQQQIHCFTGNKDEYNSSRRKQCVLLTS